jgi:hypothetical protein
MSTVPENIQPGIAAKLRIKTKKYHLITNGYVFYINCRRMRVAGIYFAEYILKADISGDGGFHSGQKGRSENTKRTTRHKGGQSC